MDNFDGEVAVVTGAASGIGAGIAKECASRGMKVVLADVDSAGLEKLERSLAKKGTEVRSVVTDVSNRDDVDELAAKTMETFGAIHLLVNNAGVVGGGSAWGSTANDWDWVLGVNLMGVVNGVRSFVPIMLDQDDESHIVNNASATGLVSYSLSAPYHVSKHGVVSLSEHLHYSLQQQAEHVGVSVLCSAWVSTRILNSGRNCPSDMSNSKQEDAATRKAMQPYGPRVRKSVKEAMPVREVVDDVFSAVEEKRFYVLPHADLTDPLVQSRFDGILAGGNPPEVDLADLLFLGGT